MISMLGKKTCLLAVICLLLVSVPATGGCGRKPGAGPGLPEQNREPGQLQPLPEKTSEIAGVKITAGGGAVLNGFIHLASFAPDKGMIDYAQPGAFFSPDGRWIAFSAVQNSKMQGLWALALDGSSGKLLVQVEEKERSAGTLILRLLGWTPDNRVVFTRQGTQPDGTHQGKRGISIRVAAPEQGEAQEAAWLPVPTGMVHQVEFLPAQGKVFVHVTGALWAIDLDRGEKKLLRDKLPSYDGLFSPRLSPTGDYYVYELFEPHNKGIYLLNTGDGKEKALAPAGETWNFLPRFSPDGRYLAYYTAPLKAGKSARDAQAYYYAGDYDILPAEDGPAPVAAGVEIVNPDGNFFASYAVPRAPGAKIVNFQWSEDGRHLAFAAGKIKAGFGENGEIWETADAIEWQSLWVADFPGKPAKVADLPTDPGAYVQIVKIGPDGKQVHYLVSKQDKSSLWLAREGSTPVEIKSGAPGSLNFPYPVPVYGEDIFLCRSDNSNESEIFRIYGTQAAPVTAGGGWKDLLGVSGKRLVYIRQDRAGDESQLVVLSCQ
ncbi:MAG: hypothetical protein C4589_11965 [Peptococcaceae bacterium]|nr:MAG: hypothetical protein C4589_11965 [Peptococcaceae bacterium]